MNRNPEPLTPVERRLLNAIYASTVRNEPLMVGAHRRGIVTNAEYRQRVDNYINPAPIDFADGETI